MSKLNLLVAFPYFKEPIFKVLKERVASHNDIRLIVDSGAFTAWNTGKEINLDDYCSFLDKLKGNLEFFAVQLDVFGDPEKSYQQYHVMKNRGYDVMPVFTRGETLQRLEDLYTYTDYIMFGGIVIGGKNKEYVKWFLNRNKGRKCHWLGFVNMPFIKAYKPESVDSSSWMAAQRFGLLHYYKGGGELSTLKKKEFVDKPSDKVISYLANYGFSYEDLKELRLKEHWIGAGKAAFMGSAAHVIRAMEVEKKLGTKVYLACAQSPQLKTIFKIKEHFINKGVVNE